VPRVAVVLAVGGHSADQQPFGLDAPVEGHQARGQLGHQRGRGDRGARPVVRFRGLGVPAVGGEVAGRPGVRQTVPVLVRHQRQTDVPDDGLAVPAGRVVDVRGQQRPRAAVAVVGRRPPARHRVQVVGAGRVLGAPVVGHGHRVVVRVGARGREPPQTRGRQIGELQTAQQRRALHGRVDVAAVAAGHRSPHGVQPDPEQPVGAVRRPVVVVGGGEPSGQR